MPKNKEQVAKLIDFYKNADNDWNNLIDYDYLSTDLRNKKGGRPKTNKNGEVRGYFRFTNLEDILNFKKWENDLDIRGKAKQKEINNLVRKGILESEAIKSIKNFRNEIRYAFSKAIFASLSPFYNKLEKRALIQESKLNIIEYKVNLLLNVLLGKVLLAQDRDIYKSLTTEEIELEPKLFALIKNDFSAKIDANVLKLKESQEKIEENNEEYIEDIFFKSKQ
ncbi:Mbov_0398 family ICE element protein [Mycoplasma sp. 125]|uniref:Mbov_0398 family ICE element protein n=1 Tax=Mycoplasma sp. 125 TaxID=3447505 RepID=UPI003F656859